MIGVFIGIIATAITSAKYGVEHWTLGRSWLGGNGMKLMLLVILLTQVGWAVTLSVMCGRAFENILAVTTGFVSESGYLINVLGLIAAVAAWLIAWKGPVAMRKMSAIVAPLMCIVMIGMAILIAKAPGGWGAVFDLSLIHIFPTERVYESSH